MTEEFKTEGVPAGEGVLLINISHSLTDKLSYRLYTISLNTGFAYRKIIANKFALPYSLALYLQCIRTTDYKTYENICSIALESPPRNRNEQKNIQLGLYL